MKISTKINPDIKEERDKVAFDVEEFSRWFHGGEEKLKHKRLLEDYFLSDPELQSSVDMSYLSHKEKYEEGIRRSTIVVKKVRKLQSEGRWGSDLIEQVVIGPSMMAFMKEGNPLVTHTGMFIPVFENLGTPEQQAEWQPKARNCEILGTYAQTELGHGTFVRGIETTATYDPKTKEFVINSPSIRAYKWWPGGLGHTCNHAVVFAQLYTQGKNCGVQPFIVQIRDLETHKPMPGVIVGEIGNKVGFNCVNNGFLGFEHVRVPLKNMLMKFAKVLDDGKFIKPQSQVLTYGTMTLVRVTIVRDQALFLSKATTIAMRYSLVRRQSPIDPNQPEPKIIEHVTQQMKIFPQIAKVIVIKAAAENLFKLYSEAMACLEKGDLSRLPEMHALSCCLKSASTDEVAQGVQICRLACGGHGYLNSAGFNDIYGWVVAAQHYEGDNTIMYLQTARFLMKSWASAVKGTKLTPTVAYLNDFIANRRNFKFENSPRGILRALHAAAAGKIESTFNQLEARRKYCSPEEASNQTGTELVKAAEIHCQVFLLQSAIEFIENAKRNVSGALGEALIALLEIHSTGLAQRMLGDMLQFIEVTSGEIEKVQGRLESNLKKFRNNAVGIVDGFDIRDEILGSTLGAYDGNVYERLLAAAKSSPLNQEDVNQSFDLHLKPFMKSNL